MKKLVLFFSFSALMVFSATAQSGSTPTETAPGSKPKAKTGAVSVKPTTETAPVTMKDHTCTVACVEGKHAYAHGEKGHTCGDACKKMKSAKSSKMTPKKTTGASSSTPPPTGAPTTTSDDPKSLKMKK